MIHSLNYANRDSSHVQRVKAIGLQQRKLTFVVLALIVLQFLTALSPYLAALFFAGAIYAWFILFRISQLVGSTPLSKWLTSFAIFIPLVNIIVLIVVNHKACEILRAAGLHVGPFGVSEEDLDRYSG